MSFHTPENGAIFGSDQPVPRRWLSRMNDTVPPLRPKKTSRPSGVKAGAESWAAPEMTRRCLVRLDKAKIPGEVRILRALSDTKPVATQGPVWYVGGGPV